MSNYIDEINGKNSSEQTDSNTTHTYTLKVQYYKLSNFSVKERGVLVTYADLTSVSDLEYTMILYPFTILQILEEYKDDGEDSDISEELFVFLEDIYDKDIDQYIFK